MPDLSGGGFGFEGRLAIASFTNQARVRARAAAEYARRKDQRFRQHVRVLERQVVEDGIALAPELLDDVHLVGMKVAAAPNPGRVHEADGVEHERLALPVPHGIAE